MRAGQVVTLVGEDGRAREATVTAIVGAGASWFKILDLRHTRGELANVPHERDATPGQPYWSLDPIANWAPARIAEPPRPAKRAARRAPRNG